MQTSLRIVLVAVLQNAPGLLIMVPICERLQHGTTLFGFQGPYGF
jgi:hypothetical protein